MAESPLRMPVIGVVFGFVLVALAFAEGVTPRNPAEPDRVGEPPAADEFGTTVEVELPEVEAADVSIPGRGTAARVERREEAVDMTVPAGSYLAVATVDGAIVGLSLQVVGTDDVVNAVRIDGQSTARALVGLLPGMLSYDAAVTNARLDVAATTVAFATLVARLEDQPVDLTSVPDDVRELAVTAADVVLTEREVRPNQQPDCGGDLTGLAAPLCVGRDPDSSAAIVVNATRGWVAFTGTGRDRPCALVPPPALKVDGDGNQIEITVIEQQASVPIDGCGEAVSVTTVGRHTESSGVARLVDGITLLSDYAGPLAQLLGSPIPDPLQDFSGAESLLGPLLPAGGPLDQLITQPTAGLVADLAVVLLSADDPAASALDRYVRDAADAMTSVPGVFLPTGLTIDDLDL